MQVFSAGHGLKLNDKNLLGIGGEARVYRWRNLAVKILHPIDPKLAGAEKSRARKMRAAKIEKIRDFPRNLPPQVVAPMDLVTDRAGHPLGYTMPMVPGAEDLFLLSRRRWREGVFSNATVTELFREIHGVVGKIHSSGAVIGDLNDANILFAGTRPWFIDADSMQFGRHLCTVAHERFLDPILYGADLTRGPVFTWDTDWYSFSVLLFSSLLYVHPYGGVHKVHKTLLRRAEARHSILRPDVNYPKAATPFSILPDDLLHWFEGLFDKKQRDLFPAGLLEIAWNSCSCGAEHARAACPLCGAGRKPVVREAVRFHGKCRETVIFRCRGRILEAVVQGNLKILYQEGDSVRR